jgi:uncharacterized membrane protein
MDFSGTLRDLLLQHHVFWVADQSYVVAAFATGVIITIMTIMITALWFAPPLVVLRDTPPLDAMKMSLSACFNNLGSFVVLGVLIYVLIWVALLPLGLGMIVLIPVLAGTLHASYQDVFGERPALPPAAAAEE